MRQSSGSSTGLQAIPLSSLRQRSSSAATVATVATAAGFARQHSARSVATAATHVSRAERPRRHRGHRARRRLLAALLRCWQLTCRAWFQYVYPAAFFLAGFWRRGTAVGGFYSLASLLLAALASQRLHPSRAGRLRCLDAALTATSLALAVACVIIVVLCAYERLDAHALRALGVVGLGAAGSPPSAPARRGTYVNDDPVLAATHCRNPLQLFPELLAALACLVGVILSQGQISGNKFGIHDCAGRELLEETRKRGQHRWNVLVGLLLLLCASVHCNVFSALYILGAYALLLHFARSSRRVLDLPSRRLGALLWIRCSLGCTAAAHVAALQVLSVHAVADSLRVESLVLLGMAHDQYMLFAQAFMSFLLLAMLSSAIKPRLKPKEDLEAACAPEAVLAGQEPDARLSLEMLSPLQVDLTERATASPYLSESSHAVRGIHPVASLRSAQDPGTSPCALAPLPDTNSKRSTATRASRAVRRTALRGRSASSQGSRWSALPAWWNQAVVPQLGYVTDWLNGSPLLPLASFLLLALIWPSASTLPLLLAGLVLLHVPTSRLPANFFHGCLVYQLIFGLSLYAYNVYCTAYSKPLSAIPGAFTWEEKFGLQSYARLGNGASFVFAHMWYVQLQSLAVVLLALAVRGAQPAPAAAAATPPPSSVPLPEGGGDVGEAAAAAAADAVGQALLVLARNVVVYARSATVLFVLSFALSSSGFSLLGLGYILWILALLASGCSRPAHLVGWDVLRGHAVVWRCLLLYSNAIVVTLFCWQIFAVWDDDLVGLTRTSFSLTKTTWPHLVIATLAAIQARVLGAGILEPVSFLVSTSPLAWLLWVGGIFCHMALIFLVVIVPPKSLDSFAFLLLYIGIVGVEQFDPASSWRNRLLTASGLFAAGLLPVRYAILLPDVQQFLEGVLPRPEYATAWSSFALEEDVKMKAKLFVFALVAILSATLRRIFGNPHTLDNAREEVMLRHLPVLARCLKEAARWSMSALMFIAYFLMLKHDAASVFQISLLLVMLIKGRRWEFAGALISACSMGLLLGQYWFDLGFVAMEPKEKAYWGLVWDWNSIRLEVAVLFLGIVQRSVQRAAAHLKDAKDVSHAAAVWRRRVRGVLMAFGAHIGGALLLVLALFKSAAWSIVFVAIIVAFRLSGDASQALPPARTNAWLRVMAVSQGLCLVYRLAAEVWLPSGALLKPTPENIGSSRACSWTGANFTHTGCGEAWMSWLDIGDDRSYFVYSFLSLFVTSLLRHLCLAELAVAGSPRASGGDCSGGGLSIVATGGAAGEPAPAAAAEGSAVEGLGGGEEAPACSSPTPVGASSPAVQRARARMKALVASPQALAAAAAAAAGEAGSARPEASQDPTVGFPGADKDVEAAADDAAGDAADGRSSVPRIRARMQALTWVATSGPAAAQRRLLPHVVYGTAALALWFSLGCAALSQPQTSAVTLGYMLLLCVHLITSESTQTLKEPFEARLRVLRYIRTFNLWVCVLWVVYQCPVVPCPFEHLQSEDSGDDEGKLWSKHQLMTPSECVHLQEQYDNTFVVAHKHNLLSIVLQCVGLRKSGGGLTFEWSAFWNIMVFVSSLVQALACSRWPLELKSALAAQGHRFLLRESRYTEHLLRWRRLELSRVDTKHEVLLLKLDLLIRYLNEVRAVWANQRERIMPEEKEAHDRGTRILNLCLRSGAAQEEVAAVLRECEAHVQPALNIAGCGGPSLDAARQAQKLVDDCVIERLEWHTMYELQSISAAEDEHHSAKLLESCHRDVAAVVAESLAEEREASAAVTAGADADAAAEDPEAASGEVSGARPGAGLEPVREQESAVAGSAQRVSKAIRDLGFMVKGPVRRAYEGSINDFLFMREGDDTLARHRRNDSLLVLLAKACLSQTFLLLMAAAVLQFVASMSIFSSVTVCAILLSLMVFPHAPPTFWKGLQVYNLMVIFIKMIYQLPNISMPDLGLDSVPWQSILGLLKVAPGSATAPGVEGNFLVCASLVEALWADLLVCAALLCHWHALRQSGHLGDPDLICRHLREDDWRFSAQYLGHSPGRGGGASRPGSAAALQAGAEAEAPRAAPGGGGLCDDCCCSGEGLVQPVPMSLQLSSSGLVLSDAERGPLAAPAPAVAEASAGGDGAGQVASPTPSRASRGDRDSNADRYDEDEESLAGSEVSSEDSEDDHEAFHYGSLASRASNALVKLAVGGAGLRKPAMDLYGLRLALSVLIFVIVFLLWTQLTNSTRSFTDSVANSAFSGQQVLVVVLVLALIVQNRAEYTWYTQQRRSDDEAAAAVVVATPHPAATSPPHSGGGGAAAATAGGAAAAEAPAAVGGAASSVEADPAAPPSETSVAAAADGSPASIPSLERLIPPLLQKVMLLVQLIVIHSLFIHQWTTQTAESRSPAMKNKAQLLLYVTYVAYLALTSLQLKYDVHVIRGGLSFTHSTDLITSLAYRAYIAIPFVEELRVLADWTVTKTSLDFFMWMKLEDAHQSLYLTTRDMLVRRMIPRASPRPTYEKVFQGGFLLVALIFLIVGPIMFFSTLNPTLKANEVIKATLTAEIYVYSPDHGEKTTVLYEAGQKMLSHITDEKQLAELGLPHSDTDTYKVEFPELSDTFWLISQSLQIQMSELLSQPESTSSINVNCEIELKPEGSSASTRALASLSNPGGTSNHTQALQRVMNRSQASQGGKVPIPVPSGVYNRVHIDSSRHPKPKGSTPSATLTLLAYDSTEHQFFLPYWRLTTGSGDEGVSVYVVTEKVTPMTISSEGSSSGSSTPSVIAIYFGVVYTIGRFLRLFFQDSSKRMIYEELPDTTLLMDLCNGVYIARIQGFLEMEYKLYYQLVQIFRSPELLLDVSRSPDAHTTPTAPGEEDASTSQRRPPPPAPPPQPPPAFTSTAGLASGLRNLWGGSAAAASAASTGTGQGSGDGAGGGSALQLAAGPGPRVASTPATTTMLTPLLPAAPALAAPLGGGTAAAGVAAPGSSAAAAAAAAAAAPRQQAAAKWYPALDDGGLLRRHTAAAGRQIGRLRL